MSDAIGIVGLGVMGANLALNLRRHGFAVIGYDVEPGRVQRFVHGAGAATRVAGAHSPEGLMEAVASRQDSWRRVVQVAVGLGIPVLAMGASLAYYDAYRTECLPANLTQAQRDYFGAHTYRRLDRDGVFHTEWT